MAPNKQLLAGATALALLATQAPTQARDYSQALGTYQYKSAPSLPPSVPMSPVHLAPVTTYIPRRPPMPMIAPPIPKIPPHIVIAPAPSGPAGTNPGVIVTGRSGSGNVIGDVIVQDQGDGHGAVGGHININPPIQPVRDPSQPSINNASSNPGQIQQP